MDERALQRMRLEAAQAHFLAIEGDPFWGEGDPDTPGRTPATVLEDVQQVRDLLGAAADDPSVCDALAVRWDLPDQANAIDRQIVVMRHQRVAALCAVLADVEMAGEGPWDAVVDLDDEAGDVAARATAQALQSFGLDARSALGRGIPPHVLLALWGDDLLVAIAERADEMGPEARAAFQRDAVAAFGRELDPVALGAALGVDPADVVRMAPEGHDLTF